MGYSGKDYCYDIELPEHKIYLNDYQIDTFPVSNAEYLEFMNEGGYDDYSFWLSDGWDAVEKNEWKQGFKTLYLYESYIFWPLQFNVWP